MKNAYAAKLAAKRQHLRAEERSELVHRLMTTIYQSAAIALNEEFGFGTDRITRFRDAMERIIIEYGALMDGTDVDYADGKLEQRYKAIMGCREQKGSGEPDYRERPGHRQERTQAVQRAYP